jgi:hypothetical protein
MAWRESIALFGWWLFIAAIVIVAVIAIVFAVLAFGESSVNRPASNIVRHDIIAKGDFVVDGEARMDSVDAESLHVHKGTSLNRLKVASLKMQDVVAITQTGPATIQLTCQNSSYRVDSPTGVFNLVLPAIADAPGQLVQIMKSQTGMAATVNVLVSPGDFLCNDSGCIPASSDPILTLLPNQADQVWLSNDFTNSWKPF